MKLPIARWNRRVARSMLVEGVVALATWGRVRTGTAAAAAQKNLRDGIALRKQTAHHP